jgi:hypothetical protein
MNSFEEDDEIFKDLENDELLEEIERFNDKYYIGISNEGLLLDLCITPKIFYKYSYDDFSKCFDSSIEIMKLNTVDDVYNVILKTHWIRLIQRVWRKIFTEHLRKRMSIQCQKYFECNGRYLKDARIPTIRGMLYFVKAQQI